MVQGTGSDVGKSLMVAGLCRLFMRSGFKVRPFKPQNMSNNAAVTKEKGEIGRAQALQARACGVSASIHMNPVLLKPEGETGAQVIVQGEVLGQYRAKEYSTLKSDLMPQVLESFSILEDEASLVIVEGAGSPAEVNLRVGDIANMGFAEEADVPVILVADINRGGVIANLVGTYELLSEAERTRIKGFIINKFRGDVSLFADGAELITQKTGWPCLGIVPWFEDARLLPAEDSMALEAKGERKNALQGRRFRIAVPRLPRIANFDDLDPLAGESDVDIIWVEPGSPIPGDVDLILLPGTKSTIADLEILKSQGWDIDIKAYVRQGGHVLGICGGFQMLGSKVCDPDGVEGLGGEIAGLGLLEVETVLSPAKHLEEVSGSHLASGLDVTGYEMHLGETTGAGLERPFLEIEGRGEGVRSADGLIAGTYVHGLFASDEFRHAFLSRLKSRTPTGTSYDASIEATLDGFADLLKNSVDYTAIKVIANGRHKESQAKLATSTS